MVQYYTLEEAAQLLRLATDKLKEMVKRNEIRAFQDRGTLRFRKPEIDEMVRTRGLGSNPEMQAGGPPSSTSRRRSRVIPDEGTFNLIEDDAVPLADPPPAVPPRKSVLGNPSSSASKKSKLDSPSGGTPRKSVLGSPSPSSGSKRKTVTPKTPSPRSPYPRNASDSDVRLVSDGSDLNFHLELDDEAQKPKAPEPPKSKLRKNSRMAPPAVSESRVPLLPPTLSDDSDVKIELESPDSAVPIGQQEAKSPSDSDVRLDGDPLAGMSGGKKRDDAMITEEIDLDAEAANIEEARKKSKLDSPALPPAAPPLPTSSPFELSENDLDMGMEPGESAPGQSLGSSGDFELTAPDNNSSLHMSHLSHLSSEKIPLLQDGSGEEVPLLQDGSGEEEVTLGDLSGAPAGASGINLEEPGDSGISLEGSEGEIEFDLSLDAEGASAGPATPKGGKEASSEFELNLPDEEDDLAGAPADSDSEFELTLDDEGSSELTPEGDDAASGSDSEFELTLDEEGGLGPADDSSAETDEEGESKDIFETDFDVPALDEESGSDAVPLDGSTDLEDSEFELDLGEEGDGAATSEDTGSEDFNLESDESPAEFDEEDEPAPSRRPARNRRVSAEEEDPDGLDLSLDTSAEDEEEEEEEEELVATGSAAPAAPWGALPTVMLLPCVIVLVVVGIMGFELIQGMWGYHKPAKVTSIVLDPIARLFDFDKELPPEK